MIFQIDCTFYYKRYFTISQQPCRFAKIIDAFRSNFALILSFMQICVLGDGGVLSRRTPQRCKWFYQVSYKSGIKLVRDLVEPSTSLRKVLVVGSELNVGNCNVVNAFLSLCSEPDNIW